MKTWTKVFAANAFFILALAAVFNLQVKSAQALSYAELEEYYLTLMHGPAQVLGISTGINDAALQTSSASGQSGSVDSSFGSNGISLVNLPYSNFRQQVKLADGKVILVGGGLYGSGKQRCALMLSRFNAGGSLDATFGKQGTLYTPVDAGSTCFQGWPQTLLLPDGKILAGFLYEGKYSRQFALVKINSDGSLDQSFGAKGQLTTCFDSNFNCSLQTLKLLPDGKILVGGTVYPKTSGVTRGFLARFDMNGKLDSTFAKAGWYADGIGQWFNSFEDITFDSVGRIIVEGRYTTILPSGLANPDLLVARFLPSGQLDLTFGSGKGYTVTDFELAYDDGGFITVLPDGKIFAAGNGNTNYLNSPSSIGWFTEFARFLADGSLDDSFANHGRSIIPFSSGATSGSFMNANGWGLDAFGRLLATQASNSNSGSYATVSRYNVSAGTLDASYGVNGTSQILVAPNNTSISSLSVENSGSAIVAGQGYLDTGWKTFLFKLLP